LPRDGDGAVCLDNLLRQPLGRRMPGHRKPEQLPPIMADNNKGDRHSKRTVGTTQRSIAAIASAWLRRNVLQLCEGGRRRRIMYFCMDRPCGASWSGDLEIIGLAHLYSAH
jgi:hypothetical protein